MQPNKIQPAVIGGIITGMLLSLPFVKFANICCCLWVICGSLVASFLYIRKAPEPVSKGDGAVLGIMTGIVGAIVTLFIGLPLALFFGESEQQLLTQGMIKLYYSISPELGRQLEAEVTKKLAEYANMSVGERLLQMLPWQLLGFVVTVGVSAIGSLLGVVLLEKRKPLQEMPPVPPPDFGNMPR